MRNVPEEDFIQKQQFIGDRYTLDFESFFPDISNEIESDEELTDEYYDLEENNEESLENTKEKMAKI